MWHLSSANDKRSILVTPSNKIIIGRTLEGQNCNFPIPEDPSISRIHAALYISEGILYLEDLGSKYGTFFNNTTKLEQKKKTKLSSKDVIKFGKLNCVWKVEQINLITCTSTLKGDNLQSLKNILSSLGGILKNEWDETCEYLTMPAITLTIKVVLALVQNSHIVTIDYWNKCMDAVSNYTPLPNPSDFIPQILESTLNKEKVSFLPNKDRGSLFAGKKVIFFSRRQLELYKLVLTKSSANALLLSESKMTKAALCEEDVIVIQYTLSSQSQDTQTQRDQINDIIDYLKSKGKRVVADAEIGLAVLYCSTSKYCNPTFNFSSEVIKQVACEKNNRNILAPETQSLSETLCKKDNLIIDESLTPLDNNSFAYISENGNNTSKRKLSEDDNTNSTRNLPKKLTTDTFSKLSLSHSKKRQAENNDLENPPKKVAVASNNDDDDVFNFVKNDDNDTGNLKKKLPGSLFLNLSKPLKRKHSTDTDDEDLFNFVNKENKKTALDKPSNSDSDSVRNTSNTHKSAPCIDERFDVTAIRGSKLQELMLISSNIPCNKHIKKEITELDEKFCDIDLGSSTVVIKDLIVKRAPIQVQAPENGLKNFKKFKKVWPLKLEVTVVSRSA